MQQNRQNAFAYCPQCGGTRIQTLGGGRKWQCPDCGFDLYNNVAAAVGLVLQNARGQILLETRAKEPRKGYLALPGGFVNPDETAEEAALRECREEVGVIPAALSYIASFPNTYPYRGIQYKTCDLFFAARLPDDAQLDADSREVSGIVWQRVQTPADIERIPLAFDSAKKALAAWLNAGLGAGGQA